MKNRKIITCLLVPFFILSLGTLQPARCAEPGADENEIKSVEERRILVSLQEERKKLQEREKNLDLKELELKSLEVEVDKKINQLKALKEEVQKILAKKENEEASNVQDLSKVYEKMDPVKAASIMADLDDELVVGILGGMKNKSAAKILNEMDPDRAGTLSEVFSSLD